MAPSSAVIVGLKLVPLFFFIPMKKRLRSKREMLSVLIRMVPWFSYQASSLHIYTEALFNALTKFNVS